MRLVNLPDGREGSLSVDKEVPAHAGRFGGRASDAHGLGSFRARSCRSQRLHQMADQLSHAARLVAPRAVGKMDGQRLTFPIGKQPLKQALLYRVLARAFKRSMVGSFEIRTMRL